LVELARCCERVISSLSHKSVFCLTAKHLCHHVLLTHTHMQQTYDRHSRQVHPLGHILDSGPVSQATNCPCCTQGTIPASRTSHMRALPTPVPPHNNDTTFMCFLWPSMNSQVQLLGPSPAFEVFHAIHGGIELTDTRRLAHGRTVASHGRLRTPVTATNLHLRVHTVQP
jgi:hypothetical protein